MITLATIDDVRAHGYAVLKRFWLVLMLASCLVFGYAFGSFMTDVYQPADFCEEDEAVWWVAEDVRGCVHYEDVRPLSQSRGGE